MAEHGEILLDDALNGRGRAAWRIPPERFVEHPEHGTVYLLEARTGDAALWEAWAGDESLRNYRVEVEILPTGEESGFLGLDFHALDDGSACCNLHFGGLPEGGERRFEGCARFGETNTSWKLGPLSQRTARTPEGEWLRLRLDAGETVANLFVEGGVEPTFTIYDLPFPSGGVRFWSYYAAAYLRNFRVTALARDVAPVLEDVWAPTVGPGVVREWQVSRMFPQGFGADDPLGAIGSAEPRWRGVSGDRRGVVNVVGIDPSEYCAVGVVFARATVESGGEASRRCLLTYTDQLTMWCGDARVFDGEPRGWNDPGRSEADGWGRLMPGQFDAELPLRAGANEILVRLEVNEPLFGSGFWVRVP